MEDRITQLERQVRELQQFARSLENAGQVSPQVAQTIKLIAGNATLAGLADVTLSSPSNGQVLEYSGGVWINATDNT